MAQTWKECHNEVIIITIQGVKDAQKLKPAAPLIGFTVFVLYVLLSYITCAVELYDP